MSSPQLCNGCGEVLSGLVYEVKKHRDEKTFAVIGAACCIRAGRHSVYPTCYLIPHDNLSEIPEPLPRKAGELQVEGPNTYSHVGRPDLGTFSVAPSPAQAPPSTIHVDLGGLGVHRAPGSPIVFSEARWLKPIPADGILKPDCSMEFFWPAVRAQKMVKAINPDAKRQSYDKNMRYLAERAGMSIEDLRKTNPVPIGRTLGLSEFTMSKMMEDFMKLSRGYVCRAY